MSTKPQDRPDILRLPKFEPLPPTSLFNRIINTILSPLFYLLYTIVLAVIVVPVWTVIDNYKHGRNPRRAQRAPVSSSEEERKSHQASAFLSSYSDSYGKKRKD